MQASLYNNPMFASGLGQLVQSFIGNPEAEAKSQLAASEALLNNQTAQYREAIGDTGLSGDLAAMMIRALQAGPDYSRYAPGIGDATIRMGALGFGRPELTPSPQIAQMMMGMGGGGGQAAPSGGGGVAPMDPRAGAVIDRARAAVRSGADPVAVGKRLKDLGIGGVQPIDLLGG